MYEIVFRPMFDTWEIREGEKVVRVIKNSLYARQEAEQFILDSQKEVA